MKMRLQAAAWEERLRNVLLGMTVLVVDVVSRLLDVTTIVYRMCVTILMLRQNQSGHVLDVVAIHQDRVCMRTTHTRKANVDGTTKTFAVLTSALHYDIRASHVSEHRLIPQLEKLEQL